MFCNVQTDTFLLLLPFFCILETYNVSHSMSGTSHHHPLSLWCMMGQGVVTATISQEDNSKCLFIAFPDIFLERENSGKYCDSLPLLNSAITNAVVIIVTRAFNSHSTWIFICTTIKIQRKSENIWTLSHFAPWGAAKCSGSVQVRFCCQYFLVWERLGAAITFMTEWLSGKMCKYLSRFIIFIALGSGTGMRIIQFWWGGEGK